MSEHSGAYGPRNRSFVDLCTICTLALVAVAGLLQRTFNNFSIGPIYVASLALAVPASALLFAFLHGVRLPLRTMASLPFVVFGAASFLFNANPHASSRSLAQDSILWSFAIVAAGVAVLVHQSGQHFERATRYLTILAITAAVYGLVVTVAGQFLPVNLKSADLAILVSILLPVSIASIAHPGVSGLRNRSRSYAALALALVALIMLSSSRSTLLVAIGALAIAFVGLRLRPSSFIGVVGALLTVIILFAASSINLDVRGRTVSPDGLVVLLRSLFVDTGDRSLDGTLDYRSDWWAAVIDDTQSNSVWVGSGPGHDLREFSRVATASPYPHNGFVTVFSHMGIFGLALFLAPLLVAIGRLRRLQRAARTHGNVEALVFGTSVAVVLWGSLVNIATDVFVESPHGALIYWAAIGASIGTALPSRRDPPSISRARRTDVPPVQGEHDHHAGPERIDRTKRGVVIGQADTTAG